MTNTLSNRRRAIKTLFCSSAALALNLRPQSLSAATEMSGLQLLAIGDFGTGAADQKAVAKAMESFVLKQNLKPEAMLLIGDNFYGPTKEGFSVDAKRWRTDIEEMYPASVLPGAMYPVLGNHDYHDNIGGEKVQLAYAQKSGVRWKMPAKWYRVDLGGAQPLLTLICLDSNLPSVSGAKDKKTGMPRPSLTAEEAVAQQEWLAAELAKPRAPFTLVMGHHPLYSNGDHGDTKPLIKDWEPLFQKHQVHAYLCGHDHDLQHLELEGKFTSHILSGGGGARTRKMESNHPAMPYGQDIHGFTHISVQADALSFAHHSVDGSLVHRFTKRLDGKVELG